MDKCYNCGTELNVDTQDREHIPAKNMFVGYSDEYKKKELLSQRVALAMRGILKLIRKFVMLLE